MANAISTVGCNGAVIGPMPAANTIGGTCMPDGMDGPGSCMAGPMGSTPFCATATMTMVSSCFYECTMGATYVSTGGCPSGTRCFNIGGTGICFRDCAGNADCAMGEECDVEGSCVAM